MVKKSQKNQHLPIHHLVMISLFGAISAILMVLEFHVPFIPPFIKMDFSEVPVIFSGFLMGPMYGVYVSCSKILLNFLLNGTTTFGIGEIVNLIGSISYVLPATYWYYRNGRGKKSAIIGIALGTVTTTMILVILNYFIMFPLYAKVMNFPLEAIVHLTSTTNPLVHDPFSLMIFMLLPFNLFKYSVTGIVTMLLYPRLEKVFLKFKYNQ